ncbi:tyrosine-type recombinase/integrase [Roseiconus lacunae]|uniref:Tyrosine-type recombinase/integrase n=1 Tax=Roseiconus lacunae TaxID=2605694 RepID=A0ABT7PJM7_9BACT|nr:tyrosine-type recombinase/integrase [Roseiconus lacunae]MDM4016685.1 tyrosine-type recombinase/integrase [Roseiconus lacunae]
MRRRYELTWIARQRRWRKRYRKQEYFFPAKPGETKESSYRRVIVEWTRKKAEVDLADSETQESKLRESWQPLLNRVREMQAVVSSDDTPTNRKVWRDLERLFVDEMISPAIEAGLTPQDLGSAGHPDALVMTTEADLRMHHSESPQLIGETPDGPAPWDVIDTGEDNTVETLLSRWLESLRKTVTPQRTDNAHKSVQRYLQTLPSSEASVVFNSSQIGRYFDDLRTAVNSQTGKDLSEKMKACYAADLKQFCRFAFSEGAIETLPRILASPRAVFKVSPKEIKTFSDKEVKEVLSEASGKTELYILLALNCGMTQVDVSDLKPSEVDFAKGTLTRKRSKTRKHENVPTVCYPLWKRTLDLLREHATEGPDRLLVNNAGNPLVGPSRSYDSVGKAVAKLREDMKRKSPLTFKLFRKTASTKLASEYPDLVELFLGHAPKTVAERHYAKPSQDRFNEAVRWLGRSFGLNSGRETLCETER